MKIKQAMAKAEAENNQKEQYKKSGNGEH